MFGTLVVCLSSPFTGRALVTRHNDLEIIYDWSTSSDQELQWAAFYGDVEHEINQVTEGNRVTLTYNLYASDCDSSACTVLDVSNTPFYKNLKAALQCPHFLRCGGTLGFICQHKYVIEESHEGLPLLKGSDRTIVLSAKSLDLTVQVKPKYEVQERWSKGVIGMIEDDEYFDEYVNGKIYIDKHFAFKTGCVEPGDYIQRAEYEHPWDCKK